MIILHDSTSADLSHIQAVADLSEGVALLDYVRIEQRDGRLWIGQVVEPNQNLSIVGDRFDSAVLHGLELMQSHANVQSVASIQVFDILLLGQYDGQRMLTPRLRPLPGAVVTKLDARDTLAVIEIPPLSWHADGSSNVIGVLVNADGVPLCISADKFNYHILVAGSTGSGKSNVSANLVLQAILSGKCVLIHDAKPDYPFLRKANTDSAVGGVWQQFAPYHLSPRPVEDVVRGGFFGKCDPDSVDRVVGFAACDFDPEMLAGFFFSDAAEQNQFEGFASSALALRQQVDDPGSRRTTYTLDDILEDVQRRSELRDPLDMGEMLHEATVKAIVRKCRSRRANLPWIDSVGQLTGNQANRLQRSRLNHQAATVEAFDLAAFVKGSRVIVIDYSLMDEASYALILSYFLRICQQYRRSGSGVGLVQLVDEAHRLFDNQSRHSGILGRAFERVMREGRSADHSIVISLQNASQVPPRVMNNLNSKIVLRANSKFEADTATQTMGREFAAQAMRLGTGHALVSLHESRATVLAQMAPSPFELMRNDNTKSVVQER